MSSLKTRNDAILRRARAGAEADLPVRVLVQTRPSLVRGDTAAGRRRQVFDAVARVVWGRDADVAQESLRSYRALWGRPRIDCWFLVDHASPRVDEGVSDESIPILWYFWNGEELVPLNQQPPQQCLQKLQRDYPFEMREKKAPKQQSCVAKKEKKISNNDDNHTRTLCGLAHRAVAAAPHLTEQKNPHLILAVIIQRLQRLQDLRPEEHAWLAANPHREHGLWDALTAGQLQWYQECVRELRESCQPLPEAVVPGGWTDAEGAGGAGVAAERSLVRRLRASWPAPPRVVPKKSRANLSQTLTTGSRDSLEDNPDQKMSLFETWQGRVEPPECQTRRET